MTTDIYWEQCVIMAKKSSILLPSLDMLILRIAESGLPAYWENEVLLRLTAIIDFIDNLIFLGIHVTF